jgi:hypothetical protein
LFKISLSQFIIAVFVIWFLFAKVLTSENDPQTILSNQIQEGCYNRHGRYADRQEIERCLLLNREAHARIETYRENYPRDLGICEKEAPEFDYIQIADCIESIIRKTGDVFNMLENLGK